MNRPTCSIKNFGKNIITQHLYRCNSCKFPVGTTCCEACANFCHSGHNLEDLGYKPGYCSCGYGCKECHCFCENPVEGDMEIPDGEKRQCEFRRTGTRLSSCDICHCSTCGFVGTAVVCIPCARLCHKRHNTDNPYHSSSAYCDCGDPSNNTFQCLLDPPANPPEPIPVCTLMLYPSHAKQDGFQCLNCNEVVCKSCAIRCHQGHNLNPLPDNTFACTCTHCRIRAELEPAA